MGLFRPLLNRELRRERGVTAIEYGILAALIGVVIIAVVGTAGGALSSVYTNVAAALHGKSPVKGCEQTWVKVSQFDDGAASVTNEKTVVWVTGADNPDHTATSTMWIGMAISDIDNGAGDGFGLDKNVLKHGFTSADDDGNPTQWVGSNECRPLPKDCDVNGNYTGDYSNWYWQKTEWYPQGRLTYLAGGQTYWQGDGKPTKVYTFDEKGTQLDSGSEYNGSDKIATWARYEHGSVNDSWYGFDNGGSPYLWSDKGNLVSSFTSPDPTAFNHAWEVYEHGRVVHTWTGESEPWTSDYTEDEKTDLLYTTWSGSQTPNGGEQLAAAPNGAKDSLSISAVCPKQGQPSCSADGRYDGDFADYRWYKRTYYTDGTQFENATGSWWVPLSNDGPDVNITSSDGINKTYWRDPTKHEVLVSVYQGEFEAWAQGMVDGPRGLMKGFAQPGTDADHILYNDACNYQTYSK